jgi:hypothetical protein
MVLGGLAEPIRARTGEGRSSVRYRTRAQAEDASWQYGNK